MLPPKRFQALNKYRGCQSQVLRLMIFSQLTIFSMILILSTIRNLWLLWGPRRLKFLLSSRHQYNQVASQTELARVKRVGISRSRRLFSLCRTGSPHNKRILNLDRPNLLHSRHILNLDKLKSVRHQQAKLPRHHLNLQDPRQIDIPHLPLLDQASLPSQPLDLLKYTPPSQHGVNPLLLVDRYQPKSHPACHPLSSQPKEPTQVRTTFLHKLPQNKNDISLLRFQFINNPLRRTLDLPFLHIFILLCQQRPHLVLRLLNLVFQPSNNDNTYRLKVMLRDSNHSMRRPLRYLPHFDLRRFREQVNTMQEE